MLAYFNPNPVICDDELLHPFPQSPKGKKNKKTRRAEQDVYRPQSVQKVQPTRNNFAFIIFVVIMCMETEGGKLPHQGGGWGGSFVYLYPVPMSLIPQMECN